MTNPQRTTSRKRPGRLTRRLKLACMLAGCVLLIPLMGFSGLVIYNLSRPLETPAWIADGGSAGAVAINRPAAGFIGDATTATLTASVPSSDARTTSSSLMLALPFLHPTEKPSPAVQAAVDRYNTDLRAIGRRIEAYQRDRATMKPDKALKVIRDVAYDYTDLQDPYHEVVLFLLDESPGSVPRDQSYHAYFERIQELIVGAAARAQDWYRAYDNSPPEQRLYYVRRMEGWQKYYYLMEYTGEYQILPVVEAHVLPMFERD